MPPLSLPHDASDVFSLFFLILSIFGFQGTTCGSLITNDPSGDGEIRTLDPLLARQVLSQLSYAPVVLSCVPSLSVASSALCLSALFSF